MTTATTSAPACAGLAVGDRAPSFTLLDQHGTPVSLDGELGARHVVLVFVPFAFSGICTGELREIRDRLEDFEGDDVTVLVVSCDSLYSMRVWADIEGYFFPLLSDFWPHGEVARAYGVFSETNGFALRGTFLIDRDGILRWSAVSETGKPRDFDEFRAALADLRSLAH
ncbi:MAG: peroxiredoxin [Actinomycetota bacterium]|nr:peroxiredoxin [Actinomycetota bacterium]